MRRTLDTRAGTLAGGESSVDGEIMAGPAGVWRRHRAAIAANLALVLAASGIVFYAVSAEGYRTHRAELNDGGIWTTNPRLGYFGRVNKQIGQYDGAVFADSGAALDIVQEGSVVVGVDLSSRRIAAIDPATVAEPEDQQATIPASAQVQLAGSTLAVLDVRDGSLRATRVDPGGPLPSVSGVDTAAGPLARVGPHAALAVTQSGTVFVVSADRDALVRLDPAADGFADAQRSELDVPVGESAALTAVGQVPVALDRVSGTLVAVGGARAVLEPGSVLQQPGPVADTVAVATPSALVTVDLATGELGSVVDGLSGRPAAPVRLGDCLFGAWSGGRAGVVRQCGTDPASVAYLHGYAGDLVFRVNRGEILLNDRVSGAVWQLDSEVPTRLEDWEAFTQRDQAEGEDRDRQDRDEGERRPPKAKPDRFGARPGRTTVLYPLDNDSAPEGRVLSIRSVAPRPGTEAELAIGPDGQTVQIRLPGSPAPSTTFEYVVDDGRRNVSARATVTVETRPEDRNQPPAIRPGVRPREWPVPAGGSIALPVLADWRDRMDGDPLAVMAASVPEADGAAVRATTDGRLRFTAPAVPGPVRVAYSVGDGRSPPVTQQLTFRVQDPATDQAVPAVAQPDIVGVEAGRWVTIRPLANDLPGADPGAPQATLALAGRIAAVPGTQVRSDLDDGTVAFRSSVPRTYSLDYDVEYGTAPLARGRIRVDVRPVEPRDPVAMPDTAIVFGPAAITVDVLANDVDPNGGLLVVQGARALDTEQLDVAVVDGRWVRVSARRGELRTGPQVVRYTISNGGRSVVGEVTVTQRPVPDDNAPVAETDRVTVRAGSAVSVPVLDNDFSPSGDALTLVGDVVGERAGQLSVLAAGEARGRHGEAFVAGRLVRYVAPSQATDAEVYDIPYLVTNTHGDTAQGRVEVSVVPRSRANRPPEPPLLEGRVTAGGLVTVKLPGAGVDPDGDAVTLLGLATAPALGRVVSVAATSIQYQAYPGSSGTDAFDYQLTDAPGARASGTVRIAVAPPGSPPRPLALPDQMTLEPGRTAVVDPLANDVVAAGDRATLELVRPPPGVRLESSQGPVTVPAPAGDGRSLEVVYRLTNGIDSSQSTITLRTATPYNNPPVVFDAFAPDTRADTVRIDLLASAYDPDGEVGGLRVTDFPVPEGVRVTQVRGRITLTKGARPLVIPFQVADRDGGAATAQLYVPAKDTGLPHVRPGAVIPVPPGGSVRATLAEYVVNPGGGEVRFTVAGAPTGSPAGSVDALATSGTEFTVTAAEGYSGPGAVTFEVTTPGDPNGRDVERAVLSVPVQVGRSRPILRCPTSPVDVPRGGTVNLDVEALCKVYKVDPDQRLDYTADWARSVDGLSIIDPTGIPIVVAADTDARAGSEAVLLLRAGDSLPGRLRVRVTEAPAPALTPIQVSDLKAGESRVVDLASHLVSGVPDPVPTVVRASRLTGTGVEVVPVGGSRVRISAAPGSAGHTEFRVVMSDLAGTLDPARLAATVLSLDVLSVPDPPPAPVPGNAVLNGTVRLSWRAPAANGARIDSYEVQASDGTTQRCPATSCDITGLTNGEDYVFTVRAHNAVGWSEPSSRSRPAQPDAVPGPVGPIRLIKQFDGRLTIGWTAPTTASSRVLRYRVAFAGRVHYTTTTSFLASGLSNDRSYEFTVTPINAKGRGPARKSPRYQSVGPPGRPAPPTVTASPSPGGDTATLSVSWSEVTANGPYPVRYTLVHDGVSVCPGTLATSCLLTGIPFDGATHTFKVQASNGRDITPGDPTTWKAVAAPQAWGAWTWEATGIDQRARASLDVPDSRGAVSRLRLLVDGVERGTWSAEGSVTRVFEVPDNDQPHSVRWEVCNELDVCSPSGTQQVQTYGPLEFFHISAPEAHLSGTELGWSIEVDGNGAPATVVVSSDVRPDQRFQMTGVDRETFTIPPLDLGFGAQESLRVALVDEARDRGPVYRRATATTPEPPPAQVQVRRGGRCSDDPLSELPRCNPDAQGADCLDESCGFIEIEPVRFYAPVTCVVTMQGVEGERTVGPIPDGEPTRTALYFGVPDNWVRAECRAESGDRTDDDRYDWPR